MPSCARPLRGDRRATLGHYGVNAERSSARTAALEPQVAADHHTLHFVRAFADLVDLAIAPIARHRILVHEPVAAVDLHGRVRAAPRHLTRKELCHGCGLRKIASLIFLPRGLQHRGPSEVDLHRHVDQLELHRLEIGYRPAELLAVLRVLGRRVVACLREADGESAYADPTAVEDVEELPEPASARAEEILLRHFRILEMQLARIRRAP